MWSKTVSRSKTAIFRKINQDNPVAHHDALEFPNGEVVLLTYLEEGQQATVLQLPTVAIDAKARKRAARV
jgi:hypothetical protein